MTGLGRAAEVLNDLAARGLVDDYALGGGIAALFYIEPVVTFDLDVFCLVTNPPSPLDPLGGVFQYLRSRGHGFEGEHIVIDKVPVQFLLDSGPLVRQAVKEALTFSVEGVSVRVARPEHLLAIAIQTGRGKDWQRAMMLLEEARLDQEYMMELLAEHGLMGQWRRLLELTNG